ncbi:MAG: ATPase [Saprospiraceae bacterium]|nr:ATPase [Saprospiraceae bacterium]MCF8252862.1 ATPase [Saprospiraceae bacterium]MCF8283323.1 ATP-binding protein [Bacteroidales bacterium]MCF8314413.1 ATPase [Saprospiraceae bacterium]MCF8443303.1 ATPase [Saprospiraceae bacterium]
MNQLIGREKEVRMLQENLNSQKSEFVAVFGRRRVGKTYLIREAFNNDFSFYLTGIANVGMKRQLAEFHARLVYHFQDEQGIVPATNWFEAFRQLTGLLEKQDSGGKKIIFLDELPWLDTRGSKFLSGLEHFWNSWASARRDILLVTCGSAASWMINNLLRNRGGLHNRVTERIKLEPFNLYETEQLLESKNMRYDRYQVIQVYMAFGGIPFYLERLKKGLSATQNINLLCFEKNAPFRTEYEDLYASLFNRAERHTSIIEALSEKNKGLSRLEIINKTGISNGGGLSRLLKELEESSFIRPYRSFGKKQQDTLYQLVDLYSLFYLNFIKNSSPDDENFWLNAAESPMYRAWSGYAFEMVCLHHVQQIKKALGISGVQTSIYSWHSNDAQIDLVIDRKDQVTNLCEMKFSIHHFAITKEYADKLRHKIAAFKAATKTRKSIFITLVTTHGLVQNQHAYLAQNEVVMDALFEAV